MRPEITIGGMSCQHCVANVKKELDNLPDLRVEDVQIGKAVVYAESILPEIITRAVEKAGYTVTAIR